jgi:sensor histidine kinase YesM
MKIIGNFFRFGEDIVSRGDKYYDKIILSSHIFNAIYIVLFSVLGISVVQNQVMRSLNTSIQMFICILLLVKYHPFREHALAHSDSNLIFSGAVFLFFNLGIIEMLNRIKQNVDNRIASTLDKVEGQIQNEPEPVSTQPEPYI